jgi:hypothetical protein
LEIEGLFAAEVYEWIFVALEQPDSERTQNVAKRDTEEKC